MVSKITNALNVKPLVAIALFATLGLAACGEKKELINQAPTSTDNTNGQAGQGLPDPGTSGSVGSTGGTGDTGTILPGPIPQNPPNPNGPPVAPPPPVVNGPTLPTRPTTPPPVTRGTGATASADGTVYTKAANDAIVDFLKARNNKVDYGTQRLNIETAKSIVNAQLTLNEETGDATVSVSLKEGQSVKVYNLSGVAAYGAAANLRLTGSGALGGTSGLRAVEGSLKCLDFDGQCTQSFARIKIGSAGSSSIVNIIFRSSATSLRFDMQSNGSDNEDFQNLKELFFNTARGVAPTNYIREAYVKSFEVVNGRSGFEFTMLTNEKQMIGFAGDLTAISSNSSSANQVLGRVMPNLDEGQKSDLARSIGDARLVSNDGAGNLKLALRLRKKGLGKPATVAVTINRDISPIIDVSDESLK